MKTYKIDFTRRTVTITKEFAAKAAEYNSYEYKMIVDLQNQGYDNAAMENFFGTLKTECLYRAHFTTRAEVEQLVTEYVDFYNFERISLKNGLTPVEIRSKTA